MAAPESHLPAGTLDELGNHCFGCGEANAEGLHLTFTIDRSDPAQPTARAVANLDRRHEGPPGYLHGGIIATLMDEAMSKLNGPLGLLAMTRHLAVDYLRPCPLHTPLTLRSHHVRREGRKLFHAAEITVEGRQLATAVGLFLVIEPELIRGNARQSTT